MLAHVIVIAPVMVLAVNPLLWRYPVLCYMLTCIMMLARVTVFAAF